MRYSLSGSTGLTWSEIRDAAQLGEQLGFDSFFAADHLMAVAGFDEDAGLLDAVSLLLALAPVTTTLRLGAMVSPITVRHPVVLARAMQTLDLISEGRAEVGVGAGWSQSEHDIFGLPFPPASRRLELLEDACRTLVSLWEGPDPVHKEGDFPLRGARLRPRPVQRFTPLLVAGASDHAVRIAARWGRAWNATGSPAFLGERVELLRAEEVRASRSGTVEITATVRLEFCETEQEREAKTRRSARRPAGSLRGAGGIPGRRGSRRRAVHRPTRGTRRLHGVVGARGRRTRPDLDSSPVGPCAATAPGARRRVARGDTHPPTETHVGARERSPRP